jgi:UDP-N-acetyl-D-glucosamine dehydrogenase
MVRAGMSEAIVISEQSNRNATRRAVSSAATSDAQAEALHRRILAREAKIGVIGLGYVGLPLVTAAIAKDFTAIGLDIDGEKVDALNDGRSYIRHIASDEIAAMVKTGRFRASSDFADIAQLDAVLVAVPTPLTRHREPDLTFIVETAKSIVEHLRPGQLIVLESTSYPGTTRDVMRPILEASGLKSGRDFYLAFSPEREDPGNESYDLRRIPKVVGGDGDQALRLARTLYDQLVARTIAVSSPEAAEAVKLTENIFRAVNIALVNELKVIYDAIGVDIWEVIEAAKTKPFGYMPFYPGPGLGGHCIPIDPFYLTWKAREYDIATRFIELAGEVNTAMPRYVVEKLAGALDQRRGMGLKDARILLIGVAYKKNIADTRESPSFKLMELLEKRGAAVAYHDPLVPEIPRLREHPEYCGRRSVALDPALLAKFDAALICTDHDAVDYGALAAHCPLIIDTRNACARAGIESHNIVKA